MIFYITIAFLAGATAMGFFAMWSIKRDVDMADLCSDDKRMIKDVLGIPN